MYDYIMQQFVADELLFYLRKSRTDDPLLTVEELLARHEARLDEWVERNATGGPVPEENRYREVVSGETIASRERIQELLRRVESPKIKAIVIVEPSRLSRGDLEDIGYLVKIFRYTNTKVITLDRGIYDLNNDRDREDFERELQRGTGYLEYTKKIMKAGTLQSIKDGCYVRPEPPYGYKKISFKEGRRDIHTLEPLPEEAEVVKRIFEMYSQGLGGTTIANTLNREHIPAPKGTKWKRDSLPRMLSNVHYIGKVKHGMRKEVRKIVDGEVVVSRPISDDYIIAEGRHPAIIDMELWEKVQNIRGNIPRNKNANNLFNPLAGLVYCSKCGTAVTGRRYQKSAPRYLCPDQANCGNSSATMDELIAEVVKVLESAVEDFQVHIEKGQDDGVERHRQTVARLEKKLADLQALELRQWDEKLKGTIPPQIFETLNNQTRAEIEEIAHELYELRNASPEAVDWKARVATFKDAILALQDPDAPVREKNKLLRACIKRIEFSREPKNGNPRWGKPNPMELHFELNI